VIELRFVIQPLCKRMGRRQIQIITRKPGDRPDALSDMLRRATVAGVSMPSSTSSVTVTLSLAMRVA